MSYTIMIRPTSVLVKCIGIFLSVLCLLSCKTEARSADKAQKTYEVKQENLHKTLYFTGTLAPLQEHSLTAPMDGIIESMPIHYGQSLQKGGVILTINSEELQKQYNDILTEYLKAKDSYTMTKARFSGTEDLWNAGLISKNNFLSEKSNLNTVHISLMQASKKLAELLDKMGENSYDDLSDLSFAKFDKVSKALDGKHNLIYLKSANPGVLLYPPKNSDEKSGKLSVGASIKSGEVLALIGDLSGVRVDIEIPEVDIDKVKPGMHAIIKSTAFPKTALQGELIAINAQALTNGSGTLPSFNAVVEVKKLTPEQQAWVKVGMSASIELNTNESKKIMVPIAAITQNHGQSKLTIRSPSGKLEQRIVVTGAALEDKVVIESGVHAGEIIIYG